jgi:hypothetical protein
MQEIPFTVLPAKFKELNRKYPKNVEKRAEEIISDYLLNEFENSSIEQAGKEVGADLILSVDGKPDQLIEVKGTADQTLAWSKLKVSSQKSHDRLVEEKVPIFRVTAVFERQVCIYVMKWGEDFLLEPEDRWAVKKVKKSGSSKKNEPSSKEGESIRPEWENSKYFPLHRFLKTQKSKTIRMSFKKIEALIGKKLPRSAREHLPFWGNQKDTSSRPHVRAWTDAGFRVERKNLTEKGGWVEFKKTS